MGYEFLAGATAVAFSIAFAIWILKLVRDAGRTGKSVIDAVSPNASPLDKEIAKAHLQEIKEFSGVWRMILFGFILVPGAIALVAGLIALLFL
jgi:hypothetical protein